MKDRFPLMTIQITPHQRSRIIKYTKIAGISIMAAYITFGVIGFLLMDPQTQKEIWEGSWFNKVFADNLTEGHNYVVEISDHIEASETLR